MQYYSKERREQAFELWFEAGQMSLEQLRTHLKNAKWKHLPSNRTLHIWSAQDNWEERANARLEIVRKALDDQAVARRKALFEGFFENAMLMLAAQKNILEKACYGDLTQNQARDLMDRMGNLGEIASTQIEKAYDLIGKSQEGNNNATLGLDKIMSLIGGELRAAVQIRGKDDPKKIAAPKETDREIIDPDDIDNK
jgi:hypothetical protein